MAGTSKTPRVRIESDGMPGRTKITNAQTGEDLNAQTGEDLSPIVRSISWQIGPGTLAEVNIEFVGLHIDLSAEAQIDPSLRARLRAQAKAILNLVGDEE